jgi:hypothetical protein
MILRGSGQQVATLRDDLIADPNLPLSVIIARQWRRPPYA